MSSFYVSAPFFCDRATKRQREGKNPVELTTVSHVGQIDHLQIIYKYIR